MTAPHCFECWFTTLLLSSLKLNLHTVFGQYFAIAGTIYSNETNVTYTQTFPAVYNPPIRDQGKKVTALMPIESGGINTLQALVVASEADLPVIDCDGEGRAVPELQVLFTRRINNSKRLSTRGP